MVKKKKIKFEQKQILLIPFHECPDHVQDILRERDDFHWGYNKYWSDFEPFDEKEDYSKTLSMKEIENYWKDQSERKDADKFVGSLEKFIQDYNLGIDVWLIETGYNFKGVKEIVFDV
jgi:hypothetical protein